MRLAFLYVWVIVCLLNLVRSLGEEPWQEAQLLIDQLPHEVDPTRINSLESDPYINPVDAEVSIMIPMDYYESEQKRRYQDFWKFEVTSAQEKYYKLLEDATRTGSYKAEAHWELKEISLYGKHQFPHNKTLAYFHLSAFNRYSGGRNSSALFELSVMHSTGLFGEIAIDVPKALVLLQEAASLGDTRAKQALAYRYLNGINLPKDLDKATVLYGELADRLRDFYSFEEWHFLIPHTESYAVRIPDLQDGLLGKGLNGVLSSATRTRAKKPNQIESLVSTNGKVVVQMGDVFMIDGDENELDKIVDIYYAALNYYDGTYTQARDYDAAAKLLNLAVKNFRDRFESMDIIQQTYYHFCLELLGHLYMRGDGVDVDIPLAKKYLSGSQGPTGIPSEKAILDLALIYQYIDGDIEQAETIYKTQAEKSKLQSGMVEFQLSKLIPDFYTEDGNATAKLSYMHKAASRGFVPAIYEYGKMLELGIQQQSTKKIGTIYQQFVLGNQEILAPHLKDAFLNLLKDEPEIALWNYAMAAEQGYEQAQVSAAWLLYQPARKLEEPPIIPQSRKNMAIMYYTRAFEQNNVDAGVLVGNIYFEMGNYEKAVELYQMAESGLSEQATWNMGYMFEYGLGVAKDFHLAKRHYEKALSFNPKIYVAIKLSVWKLRFKSLISWLGKYTFDKNNSQKSFEKSTEPTSGSGYEGTWFDKLLNKVKKSSRKLSSLVKESKTEPNESIRKDYHKAPSRFSKFFDFKLDEETFITIATIAVIVVSLLISFLGGNMNVRINGVPIAPNRDPNNDNVQDPPVHGNLNVMFFPI